MHTSNSLWSGRHCQLPSLPSSSPRSWRYGQAGVYNLSDHRTIEEENDEIYSTKIKIPSGARRAWPRRLAWDCSQNLQTMIRNGSSSSDCYPSVTSVEQSVQMRPRIHTASTYRRHTPTYSNKTSLCLPTQPGSGAKVKDNRDLAGNCRTCATCYRMVGKVLVLL